jgi:hypothetical protein
MKRRALTAFVTMMFYAGASGGLKNVPGMPDIEMLWDDFLRRFTDDKKSFDTKVKDAVTAIAIKAGMSASDGEELAYFLDSGVPSYIANYNLGMRNGFFELLSPVGLQMAYDVIFKGALAATKEEPDVAAYKILQRYFRTPARAFKAIKQKNYKEEGKPEGQYLDQSFQPLGRPYGWLDMAGGVAFGDRRRDSYARTELFKTSDIKSGAFGLQEQLRGALNLEGIAFEGLDAESKKMMRGMIAGRVRQNKELAERVKTRLTNVQSTKEYQALQELREPALEKLEQHMKSNKERINYLAKMGIDEPMVGTNQKLADYKANLKESIDRYISTAADRLSLEKVLPTLGVTKYTPILNYDNYKIVIGKDEYGDSITKTIGEFPLKDRPYMYALRMIQNREKEIEQQQEYWKLNEDDLEEEGGGEAGWNTPRRRGRLR